jgi:hypothetical protein
VVINKEMAFEMTLRNTLRFDPEKSSICKRATQTFDLPLAPKMAKAGLLATALAAWLKPCPPDAT